MIPREDRTPVERIQYVAFQLDVMATGAPPQGSLSKMLAEMASDLNVALAALGYKTAESPRQGAARALSKFGIYGVKPLFLSLVIEGHPEIGYAIEHGSADWADDLTAKEILKYAMCDMLGLTETEFDRQWRANDTGLISRFMRANERWI